MHRPALKLLLPIFALVVAISIGTPTARAQEGDVPDTLRTRQPAPPLTAFQWSLVHGRTIMLVEHGGHAYPARMAEGGVLESDPPKVVVAMYREERTRRVALGRILSPLKIDPRGWTLERRTDSGWMPAETFHFDQRYFYARTAPGTFERMNMAEIRFTPRGKE